MIELQDFIFINNFKSFIKKVSCEIFFWTSNAVNTFVTSNGTQKFSQQQIAHAETTAHHETFIKKLTDLTYVDFVYHEAVIKKLKVCSYVDLSLSCAKHHCSRVKKLLGWET